MPKKTGQRIEELSHQMGGRFKLTSLIQKRVRDYYVTSRAFMPKVDNLDELFEVVLDQIEHGEIRLRLPEEAPPTFKAVSGPDQSEGTEDPIEQVISDDETSGESEPNEEEPKSDDPEEG